MVDPTVEAGNRSAGDETPSARVPVAGPILVADDDAVVSLMVQASIEAMGVANDLVVVADGGEAIRYLAAAVTEGSATAVPVLAVLDLEMPVASGLDVVRWIRSNSAAAHLPVVLLTASVTPEAIATADELGVNAYLVKPVGMSALHDVVDDLPLRRLLVPGPGR